MEALGNLVPSEEHNCKECRLHEEGQDSLYGQRSSEHISDEPGIIAPVGSELELKDNAGGDTNGEIDSEQFHPEACSLLPEFIFPDDIDGLHHCHHQSESQGQGDEQPVICRRHRKLDSRPGYYIHIGLLLIMFQGIMDGLSSSPPRFRSSVLPSCRSSPA